MSEARAKMFWLTEPQRNTFIVNVVIDGTDKLDRIEISKDQLANFLVDGAAMALREPSSPRGFAGRGDRNEVTGKEK